jgi:2,5-diketo-D-gluconate reductase B
MEKNMQTISVKGQSVPVLGFGTWKLTGAECTDAVKFAIAEGYTHIDTAQIYENEAEVGEGIAQSGKPRDQIFLTTKVWRNHFVNGKVLESVEESLKKLKTDYVDMLLVHWPFPEVPVAKLVEGVMKAQEKGHARLIGVSNFTAAQMEEAAKISSGAVCDNQVEYHPFLSQQKVLETARRNGMFLTAYSPLARGKVFKEPVLQEIGATHGKNAGQVALRWLIQQEGVAAIPKSATKENIKGNIDIFDFSLSDEEVQKINALANPEGRQVNPDFAPKWDKAA